MSLGIYFGPKWINIAETKGKKLLKQGQIAQPSGSDADTGAKLPADVRVTQILAVLSDELKRNLIESKDAILSLSGEDLIVRTFELPVVAKEELTGAINFEAKKYIPFKVEDLITDFQVLQDKVTHTNQVLFVGIRKDTLETYVSLLSQLGLKIIAIEHAAFSLLRCIKLSKLNEIGTIGILGADVSSQDEANFLVLENGFPLFSRDFAMAGGPEETEKPEKGESSMAMEKLKTEIRVSLDYFHRKFPNKNLKTLFLVTNPENRFDLEGFISEMGATAQYIDITKAMETAVPFSLGFVKGYCASLASQIKTAIRVNILAAQERMITAKGRAAGVAGPSIFEGIRVDARSIFLGIVICAATFGYGIYKMQPVKEEIKNIISKRPQVVTVSPEAKVEDLVKKEAEYKKKLERLNNLVANQLFATPSLNAIPRVLPKGVWLTAYSFRKTDENNAELNLNGRAYLADSEQEQKAVNEFISNLRANAEFGKYFKEVGIISMKQVSIGSFPSTDFAISCKTTPRR